MYLRQHDFARIIRHPLVSIGFLSLIVLLANSFTAHAEIIRRSESGICHDSTSAYYTRTRTYTAYDTLSECLAAGGRVPKSKTSQLTTAISASSTRRLADSSIPEYQRAYFGKGWADFDADCQDSRVEALAAQSVGPVHYATSRECRIVSGRWISPFTNTIISHAADLDIDHIVPLKWAWDHGAHRWSADQRLQFANDPVNLYSVELSLNRQKGAKGPDQWLPPANQCSYTTRFLRLVKIYHLEEPQQLIDTQQRLCSVLSDED
jgi:hypothetical protein